MNLFFFQMYSLQTSFCRPPSLCCLLCLEEAFELHATPVGNSQDPFLSYSSFFQRVFACVYEACPPEASELQVLHLKSLMHLSQFCERCGSSFILSTCGYRQFLSNICGRNILFLQHAITPFVNNQAITAAWVYFWAYLSVFVPTINPFHHCGCLSQGSVVVKRTLWPHQPI